MAKNKITFKRLQAKVVKFNKAVFDEQNAFDLEGKTENQRARAEQKAIDLQCEIADQIEGLEMSKREILEHSKLCPLIKSYFSWITK